MVALAASLNPCESILAVTAVESVLTDLIEYNDEKEGVLFTIYWDAGVRPKRGGFTVGTVHCSYTSKLLRNVEGLRPLPNNSRPNHATADDLEYPPWGVIRKGAAKGQTGFLGKRMITPNPVLIPQGRIATMIITEYTAW